MTGDEVVQDIRTMFARNGDSLYGGERVTQLQHALQTATLAEEEDVGPSTIVAALLHDIGHLLHDLPENAPDDGVNDVHEELAYRWLGTAFGPAVTEPVRMHVEAKRYLCSVDQAYHASLSAPSQQSLELQGGPLSIEQARAFEERPYFAEAIRLRRWDDLAKEVDLATPSLEHFLEYVEELPRFEKQAEGRFRIEFGIF